ncbi:hypothetical protein RI129_005671 [Pyrocoelia pectoralis]|uniref:PIH1 domain-containing protein 1 n=1 Tax=Pyrocoelia pectoralis TaxID=417401 RepID=A0AAN7VFW9_9COLE
MGPKPVFLDVDSTIVEQNLLITKDSGDEISQLLERQEQYPSRLIKPTPGFCVKTKEVGTDRKLFINICQTDALPPPDDISENELTYLCRSDEICNYRIPLSIGDVRTESDKKGNDAKAVDIAINTSFFCKIENSSFFKNFLLTVVFEGLQDKHNLHATDDRVILKNKRACGTLQLHRIQQREIDNKINSAKNEGEIVIDTSASASKPIIEVLSEKQNIAPNYRVFKKKTECNVVYVKIELIGEDRVLFQSKRYHYFLDFYLPFSINSESVTSTFNIHSQILTVKMSI